MNRVFKIIIIVLAILFIWKCYDVNKPSSTDTGNSETTRTVTPPRSSSDGEYKFELTELNGIKKPKPAIFHVYTKSPKMILDYQNGDKVTYTIVSGNEHDPMCNITAEDSFGDRCTICIKPSPLTITISYDGKNLVYKGRKI